jgi:NADH-quinone oxidoreductase subunit N
MNSLLQAATTLTELPTQLADLRLSFAFLLPEIVLALGLTVTLVAGAAWGRTRPALSPGLAFLALTLAGLSLLFVSGSSSVVFLGMVIPDRLSIVARGFFLVSGALTVALCWAQPALRHSKIRADELYVLLLGLVLGLQLLVLSAHWLLLYMGLELLSLCAYAMTAYLRNDARAAEASLKYFIYGAVASALMLYGISLLYGLTGLMTFTQPDFWQALAAQPPEAVLVALLLTFAGLAYKLAALPFHFWAPDAYQGALAPVAGFFAAGPKVAGFIALMRWLLTANQIAPEAWVQFNLAIALLGFFSLLWGNLAALGQTDFRRLLAYSAIGHTGLVLLVLAVAGPAQAGGAVLLYLLVYSLASLGAFAVGDGFAQVSGREDYLGWRGLGRQHPRMAGLLVIQLVSLTGLPPTAGFPAKLLLFLPFLAVYQATGNTWILVGLVVAVLVTVVGLAYYLRPLASLLLPSTISETDVPQGRTSVPPPDFPRIIRWLGLGLTVPLLVLGLWGFGQLAHWLQTFFG